MEKLNGIVLVLQVPEGVQNTLAEVSELQLMAENQTNLEATTEQDNNNDSPPHSGWDESTHTCTHTVDRLIYGIDVDL